ncbi:DUF11 domain-containing protein [Eggerthellaceae bacterium zg-1084]|uniref:DUF11 domain-containing protein n=1 Tax=Berryella wangjianweii TaxID=2734634 RepID=UPI0015570D59|nr:DUF11 domain-containing protein [Berryella wangjianweii]NPD31159.1 DUF11 domain-containing protein [Berryella wangjianweii]
MNQRNRLASPTSRAKVGSALAAALLLAAPQALPEAAHAAETPRPNGLGDGASLLDLPTDNQVDNPTAEAAGFSPKPVNGSVDARHRVRNPFYIEGDAAKLTEANGMWKTTDLPGWQIVPTATGDGEVIVFYDNLRGGNVAANSGGLVTGFVALGSFYDQHINGRDAPWLTAYGKSKDVRIGWGSTVPSSEVRLLYLKAGQGVAQTFDVAPGQHFAVEGIAMRPDGAGPNGIRVRLYDADTGKELTGYGAGSNNVACSYPASWGLVSARVERVPAGVARVKAVVSTEGAPMIIGPVDVRGGANLQVSKDVVEAQRTPAADLMHDNDASYDGGRAIRQGDTVTVALEVRNVGQGITKGNVTVRDTIPPGFELVPGSARVIAGNGVDITASVIGPNRVRDPNKAPHHFRVSYDDFFKADGADVTIKLAADNGSTGLYPMRTYGAFYGMGFEGFDSNRGSTATINSRVTIAYQLRATASKDTIGPDRNGGLRDLASFFTQPCVTFVNLWEGAASERTNHGPVVRMSLGTNTPPSIALKAADVTVRTSEADAADKVNALRADLNVAATDYEDGIRNHATTREIVGVTRDGAAVKVDPADLTSLLATAGTYRIAYRAKDADGNASNVETATLTVVNDRVIPAPQVGSIDTAATHAPVTLPEGVDARAVAVTFPGKGGRPVVVTAARGADGSWALPDGTTLKVVGLTLEVPAPADATLTEAPDAIAATVSDGVATSAPGRGAVTNEAPTVAIPADSVSTQVGSVIDLTAGVFVADREDDARADDAKVTHAEYTLRGPDGVEAPVALDELRAFVPGAVGAYAITVTPIDSDGKRGAPQTFTLRVTDAPAIAVNDPELTLVRNPAHLTDEERETVRQRVLRANPDVPEGSRVAVGPDGTVTVSIPDRDAVVISPERTVRRADAPAEARRPARVSALPVTGDGLAVTGGALTAAGLGALLVVARARLRRR